MKLTKRQLNQLIKNTLEEIKSKPSLVNERALAACRKGDCSPPCGPGEACVDDVQGGCICSPGPFTDPTPLGIAPPTGGPTLTPPINTRRMR